MAITKRCSKDGFNLFTLKEKRTRGVGPSCECDEVKVKADVRKDDKVTLSPIGKVRSPSEVVCRRMLQPNIRLTYEDFHENIKGNEETTSGRDAKKKCFNNVESSRKKAVDTAVKDLKEDYRNDGQLRDTRAFYAVNKVNEVSHTGTLAYMNALLKEGTEDKPLHYLECICAHTDEIDEKISFINPKTIPLRKPKKQCTPDKIDQDEVSPSLDNADTFTDPTVGIPTLPKTPYGSTIPIHHGLVRTKLVMLEPTKVSILKEGDKVRRVVISGLFSVGQFSDREVVSLTIGGVQHTVSEITLPPIQPTGNSQSIEPQDVPAQIEVNSPAYPSLRPNAKDLRKNFGCGFEDITNRFEKVHQSHAKKVKDAVSSYRSAIIGIFNQAVRKCVSDLTEDVTEIDDVTEEEQDTGIEYPIIAEELWESEVGYKDLHIISVQGIEVVDGTFPDIYVVTQPKTQDQNVTLTQTLSLKSNVFADESSNHLLTWDTNTLFVYDLISEDLKSQKVFSSDIKSVDVTSNDLILVHEGDNIWRTETFSPLDTLELVKTTTGVVSFRDDIYQDSGITYDSRFDVEQKETIYPVYSFRTENMALFFEEKLGGLYLDDTEIYALGSATINKLFIWNDFFLVLTTKGIALLDVFNPFPIYEILIGDAKINTSLKYLPIDFKHIHLFIDNDFYALNITSGKLIKKTANYAPTDVFLQGVGAFITSTGINYLPRRVIDSSGYTLENVMGNLNTPTLVKTSSQTKIAGYSQVKNDIATLNALTKMTDTKLSQSIEGYLVTDPLSSAITLPKQFTNDVEFLDNYRQGIHVEFSHNDFLSETATSYSRSEGDVLSLKEPVFFEDKNQISTVINNFISHEQRGKTKTIVKNIPLSELPDNIDYEATYNPHTLTYEKITFTGKGYLDNGVLTVSQRPLSNNRTISSFLGNTVVAATPSEFPSWPTFDEPPLMYSGTDYIGQYNQDVLNIETFSITGFPNQPATNRYITQTTAFQMTPSAEKGIYVTDQGSFQVLESVGTTVTKYILDPKGGYENRPSFDAILFRENTLPENVTRLGYQAMSRLGMVMAFRDAPDSVTSTFKVHIIPYKLHSFIQFRLLEIGKWVTPTSYPLYAPDYTLKLIYQGSVIAVRTATGVNKQFMDSPSYDPFQAGGVFAIDQIKKSLNVTGTLRVEAFKDQELVGIIDI